MKILQFVLRFILVAVLPTPILSQGTCRCENNGVCQRDVSGAGITCICPSGYRGIICEIQDAVNCQCQNGGLCQIDANGDRTCLCPAGYNGVICQYDSCHCQNNGVCQYASGGGIRCDCPMGFTGVLCEEQTNRCDCKNGGTCIHDVVMPGGIMCTCPLEFTGILCNMLTSADTVPPTITFCPDDSSINPTSNKPIYVTWPEPQAVDNSGVPPSVVQNVPTGTFLNVGDVLEVAYSFSDAAGNLALCQFKVTAVDDIPPDITYCPPDIMQSASKPNTMMFVTWALPMASDNSGKLPQFRASAVPGIFVIAGNVLSVSYVFTDESGNQATCDFNIVTSVPFVPGPMIVNCPSDVTLNVTDPSGMAVGIWVEPTASNGSDDILVFRQSHQSGASFGEGTTVVTYVFRDTVGNEAQCSFTVTVMLEEVIAEPPVSIDVASVTATSAIVTWTGPNSTFDSFQVATSSPLSTSTISVDPSQESLVLSALMPNTNYRVDISTVVGTDTDSRVVSTPVAVTFKTDAVDTMPPTIISCPSDITLPASRSIANWTEPTAVDDSGLAPAVSKSHEPGATFVDESTNVTYTFTDTAGNTAQCVFTVNLVLVLEPPTSIGIINITTSSALFSLIPPNSTFDIYVATLQGPSLVCTVTFPANETTLAFPALIPDTNYTVSVSTAVAYGTDNEVVSEALTLKFTTVAIADMPPAISDCPSDITLPAGQSVANWTEPTAVDDSGLAPAVTKSHEPGATFVDESTNVTYTFTDTAGNTAQCVFTVNRVLALDPPTSIGIVSLTSTLVYLSWTPPNSTFEVYVVIAQGSNLTVDGALPNLQNTLLLPGLMPGANYTVSVSTAVAYGTDNEVVSEPISISFTTTVEPDAISPTVIGCPPEITLPIGQNVANWTEPTAVDDSGFAPAVSKSHEPGATFVDESTNVTYTFTDTAGNTAQCVFTVNRVTDVTPPVIEQCLSFITLPTGNTGTWMEPTATDDSGEPPLVTKSHEPGTVLPEGFTNVVYTFTDAAGNQAVCSFLVNRPEAPVDNTPPVISGCPSDIALQSDMAIANWTEPSATDDSGNPPSVIKSNEPGTSFLEGNTTVTYTFTDAAGNQANCSFVVTVTTAPVDNTPPVISGCPSDIALQSDMAIANWTEPSATDDSGNPPSVIKSNEPGTSFLEGNTTVTYTFTDAAGNQANCSFVVTVTTALVDSTPPVVSGCPSDIVLPLDTAIANWTEPMATDDSGNSPSVVKSHEPGTSFSEGNTTVMYTFTDDAGNQANCSFFVIVTFDTMPPVISDCPADIMLPFASTLANWTEPTATDNSGQPLIANKTHEPGTDFSDGNTTVLYTFTDAAGNRANCSFVVNIAVDDVEPLVLSCPSNVTIPYGNDTASWTEPTATDNSGQVPTVIRSHAPGATFSEETTLVTYTFTDVAGNQANCVFLVKRLLDNIPPAINGCTPVIILPTGTNMGTWEEPTATDDSGEEPSVTKTHEPGSVFTDNVTMVVYTFTDVAGNQANCVFFIKLALVDDIAPAIINCPIDMNVSLPLTQQSDKLVTWQEPSATDNSGEAPSINQTHRSGDTFPEGMTKVTYTFIDGSGNGALCSFQINIQREVDDIAPAIIDCPIDMNVSLPLMQQSDKLVTWQEPSATDNSGEAPSINQTHQSGDFFLEGTTRVTYTFTDGSDNGAVCSFTVDVQREEDVTPPSIFNCPANRAYIIPAGNQFMIVMWNPPFAVDNSGEQPEVESNRKPGDVFREGTTTVVYNFTDQADNVARCEFSVSLSTPVLNPCQSRPCRPNENCFYSAMDHICIPGPFRKKREVLDIEDAKDTCLCENRGTCQRDEASEGIRCICPQGFTGILCQQGAELYKAGESYSLWGLLSLTSLATLGLLVILVALYHSKKHRTGKLGYDISSLSL